MRRVSRRAELKGDIMPENETRIGHCNSCGEDGVRVKAYGEDRRQGERLVTARVDLCYLCASTFTGNRARHCDAQDRDAIDRVRLARMMLRRLRRIESIAKGERVGELEEKVRQLQTYVDQYDEAATRARNALTAANIPEITAEITTRALDLEARIKMLAARVPRCSCDDVGDEPCRVHARENVLQDELVRLRNLIGEAIEELNKGTTDATIRDALAILRRTTDVDGETFPVEIEEVVGRVKWTGDVGMHAGTGAVLLAARSIHETIAHRDPAAPADVDLWNPIELAIRNHLGNAMRGGEVHGFDVKVDAETNPPSVLEAGHVVAHVVVKYDPSPIGFGSRFEFQLEEQSGRLIVHSSPLR